ncbi:MAG: histidinol dehydrogenase [Bacteroidota bacterium]
MQVITNPARENWQSLLKRPVFESEFLRSTVSNILDRVKSSGDKALFEFNEKFDGAYINHLETSQEEIQKGISAVDDELKEAIQKAASNIKRFHEAQKREVIKVETMPGVTCWRQSVPIEKVGIYIPGGTAPLFSTVLMLAIPANLAGSKEIILCTPPDKEGSVNPVILYTAHLVGVTRIFKIGGAQAIAAMAYGTESIPKTYKIFGPGNQYVTEAKQQVALEGTAIDMPAGPSEVAIIADETSDASFIAADLLSQAEHGVDSQVILFCTNEEKVMQVNKEVKSQVQQLPRKEMAQQSLRSSKAFIVENIDTAVEMSNTYAPEHLIVCVEDSLKVANQITNAGSVFIGELTPESAGDYASGTNHTLPTNGAARSYSGVSLDSFMKQITYQSLTEAGLRKLGPVVETMADAELLVAHKNAVSIRLDKIGR